MWISFIEYLITQFESVKVISRMYPILSLQLCRFQVLFCLRILTCVMPSLLVLNQWGNHLLHIMHIIWRYYGKLVFIIISPGFTQFSIRYKYGMQEFLGWKNKARESVLKTNVVYLVLVTRFECFRALKLSRLEYFRTLVSFGHIGGF